MSGTGGRIGRGEDAPGVGAELELRVERLAAGGDGVARDASGRVVFVPGTAPGDRVRAVVVEARRRFARAELRALLEPGPDRVTPRCEVFGVCGGCTWQHLSASAQRAAKAAILRDAVVRLGGLPDPGPVPVEPSPSPWGWRSRARVAVQGGRVGFRRLRSRAVCATSRCPVLVPALEAGLAALAQRPPGDGERVLAVGDAPDPGPAPGVGVRSGEAVLHASPGVFFQAHQGLRARLAEAVLEAAGRGESALELFAGIGFFTLPLARRFARVEAVEGDPVAAADLRGNLARSGVAHVRVVQAPVGEALAARRGGAPPDALVLDPPRTGLDADARAALPRQGARRIVYVSCDPATFARDAAALAAAGYALRTLRGFDLFPHTPHVECVALLSREGAGDAAG